MALNAALAEVCAAFRERGIRTLVIKGVAAARWLYDDPMERSYGDVDLLVAPEQFGAAETTLARLGFVDTGAGLARAERADHEHAWRRADKRPAVVDLHQGLPLVPGPEAWTLLSADTRSLIVGGERIETPAVAAHLVIVSLHAAQHGAGWPKPLEDLRRAIARVDLASWRAAGALANELGSAGAMRAGLQLVSHGAELADRLGLADDAPRSVRLHALIAPKTLIGIERLVSTPGLRGRVGLIGRELVPSRGFMRGWQPLANRGALGLVLAYLWRPLWLAAKLPRAARAWVAVAMPSRRRARLRPLLVGGWWALRAWICCRMQLRRGGLEAVRLPRPPAGSPWVKGGVDRALLRLPASCLERSLVRQCWYAAPGQPLDVVIGVRGPVARFAAHAWLDGDTPDPSVFTELRRWPPSTQS